MAARVYERFDSDFANKCLEAAVAAWEWLVQHPDAPGFKNPPEISTGEYGDEMDKDERYWAAAELYRTTGKAEYHQAFLQLAKLDFPKYGLGWGDMGGYGTIAYLLNGVDQADSALHTSLKEGLLVEAERLVQQSREDGYQISLKEEDYIWGSNMLVMNNAMLLLVAEYFSDDSIFAESALDQIGRAHV